MGPEEVKRTRAAGAVFDTLKRNSLGLRPERLDEGLQVAAMAVTEENLDDFASCAGAIDLLIDDAVQGFRSSISWGLAQWPLMAAAVTLGCAFAFVVEGPALALLVGVLIAGGLAVASRVICGLLVIDRFDRACASLYCAACLEEHRADRMLPPGRD